ncbi:MAG: NAD(P)H-hydrate dehydratase [Gemmatimonadaceae bacterium]
MTVRVVSASQATARDDVAIAAGIPSMQLMRSAGEAAARIILDRYASEGESGVLVFCGPGNNGGDGWIVAAALARAGLAVRVVESAPPRGDDARAAKFAALSEVSLGTGDIPPALVVDALLGTGARGELREPVVEGAREIARRRAAGACVISLDMPTGIDATTGEAAHGSVTSDLTITFGTAKRGLLQARCLVGEILVVDIGLGRHADLDDGAPRLIDAEWVRQHVPAIPGDAHKGVRRKVLLVGGDQGMAGAIILAARAALRSGAGMVRGCLHEASVPPFQVAVPEATALAWPEQQGVATDAESVWPDALLIGPGLGADARRQVTHWLGAWRGPVVLDADALNAFAGDEQSLGDLLDGRPAIVTPHPAEFARLIGVDVDTVLDERFEIGARLARALHAVVLLKGMPTVVTAPDGEALVSASGNASLATAGSGDVLGGIAVTLLAQSGDPLTAAACAAWVHGHAAERAVAGRPVRGVTLPDVLDALGHSWHFPSSSSSSSSSSTGVLAALPALPHA